MAFASGCVSYQKFFIDGAKVGEVDDAFVETLNTRAFGKSGALADDTQIGWIGPDHLFQTEILADDVAFGRFVHLSLRVDRLKAPPNVLKSYIRMEQQVALQASGREFLSRAEKRMAKEAALARVDKEIRAGGFRRMNSYPVLIDLERRTVYLAALGALVADVLMQLFSETFGDVLEPADVERTTLRLMSGSKHARAIENLTSVPLVRPPDGYDDAAADFMGSDLGFLGKELLTWLWYQIDSDEGALRLETGDDIVVMIDQMLRLKCDFGLTGTTVITADGPTALPEARAALRIGKQPTKAGLIVGVPAGEFRFKLDAARMSVSGLTLPDDDPREDARGRLEQRFERVADAADLIDALFELFLQKRLAGDWDDEWRKLSAWAQGESKPALLRAASA
ncbi:MAG: hypothetical protein IID33_04855 [Planctomycetes bacterium]|nr:hypothetical protein [Planctomycetota bacterium]